MEPTKAALFASHAPKSQHVRLNKVSAEASQPHAAQAVPDDMPSLHSICAAAITSSAEHITRKIC